MEQERIEKLAEYLEEPVENFKEGYTENIVENTETGEIYFVGTYDESYEEARDSIESTFDDLGLDAFTPWFQTWIVENALEEEWFEDAQRESFTYYVEDIENENDETFEWYKLNFGLDRDFVKNGPSIDMEVVVDKAIEEDGIAHFVARYDGKEIELDDDLFAYRID